MSFRRSHLLKHFLQVIFISAAAITGFSRISDYKHHWSDVLAGTLLGTVISIIVCVYVSDLFRPKNKHVTKTTQLPM